MYQEILYSRHERSGGVFAEIRLNRPAKGNAITFGMLESLADIARELAGDPTVGVVVLRGEGKFFCTGGDIAEWSALSPAGMHDRWILRGLEVLQAIASLPQPVIAAINGHALGGGLELAMHADLRLAEQSALFGTPEVKLGMVAGWGGVRRLAETVGVSRAQHLTLLGDPVTAQQAHEWGLITAVAKGPAEFDALLEQWIARLLANSGTAMTLTKGLLAGGHQDFRNEHADAAAHAIGTPDCAEGVKAFLEKRPPVFRRQP